ncbi:hypothetical protein D6D25_08916 [Aureobasidium pullulans]|nr:hypothetical protein D6D25_08916 [Aureobasidium pullulans]
MHIIGQAQKREQKTANGSIDPAALKHLQSATEASPLQKRSKNTSKSTRTDIQVAADVDDSSDNVSETEGPNTPSVRRHSRVQIPATPPQTPSPRRKTGAGKTLYALEEELDDIGNKPEIQLGDFARLYLEDLRSKPPSRETPDARVKSLARHILDILGFGKQSNHSKEEVTEKTRVIKAQRMTAKGVKAFVDVSDKTIRPLLEKLAANKAELCKISELARAVVSAPKAAR